MKTNTLKINKIILFLKRCIFTKFYCTYYPLKLNSEKIISIINECKTDEEYDIAVYLYKIVNSEVSDLSSDNIIYTKNHQNCYKIKKFKEKDENGNKIKTKHKKIKSSMRFDEQKYKELSKNCEERIDELNQLSSDIENGSISESQLSLLDSVIYSHRINTPFYIAVALCVIAFISIIVINNITGWFYAAIKTII